MYAAISDIVFIDEGRTVLCETITACHFWYILSCFLYINEKCQENKQTKQAKSFVVIENCKGHQATPYRTKIYHNFVTKLHLC